LPGQALNLVLGDDSVGEAKSLGSIISTESRFPRVRI
jgi:hypothetical protein